MCVYMNVLETVLLVCNTLIFIVTLTGYSLTCVVINRSGHIF